MIQKGRLAEAEKQLRRINRINRNKLDEAELRLVLRGDQLEEIGTNAIAPIVALISTPEPLPKKQYSYWHLFSTKSFTIYTLVLSMT